MKLHKNNLLYKNQIIYYYFINVRTSSHKILQDIKLFI